MFGLTWIDTINLVLGIAGVGISIWSFAKAHSAKSAVDAVINRHTDKIDIERLRALVVRLNSTKEVAKRRWKGAPKSFMAGYSVDADFRELQETEDALKTQLPFTVEKHLAAAIRGAAEELSQAIKVIADDMPDRDGWKDALSTLQTIVPRLEQAEREIGKKELRLTEEI